MKHYSLREIAALLDRSPRTIRDWITTGCPTAGKLVLLDAVKMGRWWSVSEESLVLFQHRVAREAAADRPRLSEEAGPTAPPGPRKGKGKPT